MPFPLEPIGPGVIRARFKLPAALTEAHWAIRHRRGRRYRRGRGQQWCTRVVVLGSTDISAARVADVVSDSALCSARNDGSRALEVALQRKFAMPANPLKRSTRSVCSTRCLTLRSSPCNDRLVGGVAVAHLTVVRVLSTAEHASLHKPTHGAWHTVPVRCWCWLARLWDLKRPRIARTPNDELHFAHPH